MHDRTPDYWLGSLAMTVALAAKDPEPKPILTTALREFLRDHPAGDPLGDVVRAAIGGK